MENDGYDLPAAKPSSLMKLGEGGLTHRTKAGTEIRLNEKQLDKVIDAGIKTTGDLADIVKDIVEIWKIREKADAIEKTLVAQAETRVLEARAEVKKLRAKGKLARDNAKAFEQIMTSILPIFAQIPEMDAHSRTALINQLPEYVRTVLSTE